MKILALNEHIGSPSRFWKMRNQVTLLTHSDPGELLPGDTLRFSLGIVFCSCCFFRKCKLYSQEIHSGFLSKLSARCNSLDQEIPFLASVLTCCEFQEHALPKNASRSGPLFWDLGGKVNFSFSLQIILGFIQVPSSIEGPGCVAAEAIFDRVEQIDFAGRWRAYTSENQLGDPWSPLTILNMESLLFPSIATRAFYLYTTSFYNCYIQILICGFFQLQWNVISLRDCWIWNKLKDISFAFSDDP